MNDKYAKEIAKELKLIRKELQKVNKGHILNTDNLDKDEIEKMLNNSSLIFHKE